MEQEQLETAQAWSLFFEQHKSLASLSEVCKQLNSKPQALARLGDKLFGVLDKRIPEEVVDRIILGNLVDALLQQQGWKSGYSRGWQRDLLRECVEPNPGPSWEDVKDALNKKLGAGAESYKDQIAKLQVELNKLYNNAPDEVDIHKFIITPDFRSIFGDRTDKIQKFIYEIIPAAPPPGGSSGSGAGVPTSNTIDLSQLPPPNGDSAKKIEEYFNTSSSIRNFMMRFSGLHIPLHPSARYTPKTMFLRKDLPCVPGSPGVLDLRLLAGDGGDPTGEMKPVKLTRLQLANQDETPYADAHLFLAGHAMGKTKAIFDLAAQRYTVLLDASGATQGQQDIASLFNAIHNIIAEGRDNYFLFVQRIVAQFIKTFIARLIALQLLIAVHNITPTDWRDLQLNGLCSSNYGSFLHLIQLNLSNHPLDDIMVQLLTFHHIKHAKRMLVAFDEANIWLEQFKYFKSINDGEAGQPNRPIWYAIAPKFFETASLAMIIAGTRIRLKHRKILISAVGKLHGRNVVIHASDEFGGWDKQDVMDICSRLFTEKFTMEMRTALAMKLCGNYKTRPRFPSTYAEFLDTTSTATSNPLQILDEFIDGLTGSGKSWSIGHHLENAVAQFPTPEAGYKELRKLLFAYLTGVAKLEELDDNEIDWVAGGICLLETINGKLFPRLTENLVAESIDRYLESKQISLVRQLIRDLIAAKPDPAYCGPVFDAVIASALRNAALKNLGISFLKHIPWASSLCWTGPKHIAMLESFESTLASACPIVLPPKQVGMDVVANAFPFQIFICNKISFMEKNGHRRSINARDVKKKCENFTVTVYPVKNPFYLYCCYLECF